MSFETIPVAASYDCKYIYPFDESYDHEVDGVVTNDKSVRGSVGRVNWMHTYIQYYEVKLLVYIFGSYLFGFNVF